MKIEKTTQYRDFRRLKGNRPINEGKVKKLVESVNSGLNLFQYCPVLVNEDMYIIDGQHRIEACKKLGFPIYYCIIPNINLLQIAQLNSAQARWKTSDFFNCFIQTGNKDYLTLQFFIEKWGLGLNAGIGLLMYGGVQEGSNGSDIFKEGKFQVRYADKANKLLTSVFEYASVVDDEKILVNRSFIRAIQLLLNGKEYNHLEVIKKLKDRKSLIVTKSNYKEYIYHIEELFNRGNSIRKIIYKNEKNK